MPTVIIILHGISSWACTARKRISFMQKLISCMEFHRGHARHVPAYDDTKLQKLVRLPQSSEFIIHSIRIGDQAAARIPLFRPVPPRRRPRVPGGWLEVGAGLGLLWAPLVPAAPCHPLVVPGCRADGVLYFFMTTPCYKSWCVCRNPVNS